jgi:hypothetical protein
MFWVGCPQAKPGQTASQPPKLPIPAKTFGNTVTEAASVPPPPPTESSSPASTPGNNKQVSLDGFFRPPKVEPHAADDAGIKSEIQQDVPIKVGLLAANAKGKAAAKPVAVKTLPGELSGGPAKKQKRKT